MVILLSSAYSDNVARMKEYLGHLTIVIWQGKDGHAFKIYGYKIEQRICGKNHFIRVTKNIYCITFLYRVHYLSESLLRRTI